MELITNWEAFNTASLAFCQFQGLLGIIIMTGITTFKYNLGGKLTPSKLRKKIITKRIKGLKTQRESSE